MTLEEIKALYKATPLEEFLFWYGVWLRDELGFELREQERAPHECSKGCSWYEEKTINYNKHWPESNLPDEEFFRLRKGKLDTGGMNKSYLIRNYKTLDEAWLDWVDATHLLATGGG